MKLAFCLAGKIGGLEGKDGLGKPTNFGYCFSSFYENIISRNDTDVFIHSWSTEVETELTQLYTPVKSIFEPQKEFPNNKEAKFFGGKGNDPFKFFLTRSRFYSIQKVLELKKKFELDNGFIYDAVMLTRFDLLWHTPLDFSLLDLQFFYVSNWNRVDYARKTVDKNNIFSDSRILDLWFFSNSKFMDYFGDINNMLEKVNVGDPHAFIYWYLNQSEEIKNKIRYKFYRYFDCDVYRDRVAKEIKNGPIFKGNFTTVPRTY